MKKIIKKLIRYYFKEEIEIMLNEDWKDVKEDLPKGSRTVLCCDEDGVYYMGKFDPSQGWAVKSGPIMVIIKRWRYISLKLDK